MERIPFQYSLHYQKDARSVPLHCAFLRNAIDDLGEDLKEIEQRRNEMLAYYKLDTEAVLELFKLLY